MVNPRQVGDRVVTQKYGPGTIAVAMEYANGAWPDQTPKMYATGRVGIVLDNHTLHANPAYFWERELVQ